MHKLATLLILLLIPAASAGQLEGTMESYKMDGSVAGVLDALIYAPWEENRTGELPGGLGPVSLETGLLPVGNFTMTVLVQEGHMVMDSQVDSYTLGNIAPVTFTSTSSYGISLANCGFTGEVSQDVFDFIAVPSGHGDATMTVRNVEIQVSHQGDAHGEYVPRAHAAPQRASWDYSARHTQEITAADNAIIELNGAFKFSVWGIDMDMPNCAAERDQWTGTRYKESAPGTGSAVQESTVRQAFFSVREGSILIEWEAMSRVEMFAHDITAQSEHIELTGFTGIFHAGDGPLKCVDQFVALDGDVVLRTQSIDGQLTVLDATGATGGFIENEEVPLASTATSADAYNALWYLLLILLVPIAFVARQQTRKRRFHALEVAAARHDVDGALHHSAYLLRQNQFKHSALLHRAKALLAQEKSVEAQTLLDKLEVPDRTARWHVLMSNAKMQQGNKAGARMHAEKARELQPAIMVEAEHDVLQLLAEYDQKMGSYGA